jgi:hypothetical protein
VIHRDLKPGNILLGKDESVKIADFGIARVARDSVSRLTSQQDSGTLLYMSPEQLLGKSGEASVIYSLGVVLYEMLAGDPPFTSGDIPHQIREVVPPPPRGVSEPLSRIVMKCLEKNPEMRFACPKELRESLERPAVEHQQGAAAAFESAPRTVEDRRHIPADRIYPPAPAAPPVRSVEDRKAVFRAPEERSMMLKYAFLGACGFGIFGILACTVFLDDPSRLILQLLLFACPIAGGILGAWLLQLKRRALIACALGGLACGILLLTGEFNRGEIETLLPFTTSLLVVGGGGFGAYVGRVRWRQTSPQVSQIVQA